MKVRRSGESQERASVIRIESMGEKLRRLGLWGAQHPVLTVMLAIALLAVLTLGIWAVWPSTAPNWSGIQGKGDPGASRTLWDWLELLLIPLALLAAAWWIARSRRSSGKGPVAPSTYRGDELEVLDDRYQEGRLQAYYNRIQRLLLDHGLRQAGRGDEVRRIARAQTLTVLWGLNGERKGMLTRFLHEAELIMNPDPVISLAGANLSAADLRGANLQDSNLRQARLIKANLARAELSKTDLGSADLEGADLRGALSGESGRRTEPWTPPNLANTNLNGVILREARLAGIDLTSASMDGARLERADLREAILGKCALSRANLSGAKLQKANLRQAVLIEANLDKANLDGATIVDATLSAAILSETHCTQTNFKGSDLGKANFARATLNNAFLQECDLRGADLSGANLRGANLSGANLVGATLKGADLRGAYLSTAKVTQSQLSEALSTVNATLPDNAAAGKKAAVAKNEAVSDGDEPLGESDQS